MIRLLLSLLCPTPSIRSRFERYVPPARYPGESLEAFRMRQVGIVMARSNLGGVYEHEGEG
jgi:hypothetical protein